ncbi:hypothetical protein [Nannocystis pusilla]|uniref:hypothetical protein n=1 Tax=Nannocystis pusilla TaxID=889268 RepID=UPI003B7D367E
MHPTLDELLVQFRGLLDAHRAGMAPSRAGEGNLRCDGCLDCNRCRFCVQCVRCNDCSNCELCHDCRACTRSRMSRSCVRSGHLEFCEGCEDSQYLVLCVDCTGCTQCFACVGLKNEEFCVLNQRYSRKDYFPAVQALKRRLEEAIAGGSLLTEIAAIGRGAWPPRGFDIPRDSRRRSPRPWRPRPRSSRPWSRSTTTSIHGPTTPHRATSRARPSNASPSQCRGCTSPLARFEARARGLW